MNGILRFDGAVARDPAIDAWLDTNKRELLAAWRAEEMEAR